MSDVKLYFKELCSSEFPLNDREIEDTLNVYDQCDIVPKCFFKLMKQNIEMNPIAGLIYLFYLIDTDNVDELVRYHLGKDDVDYEKMNKKIEKIKTKKNLLNELGIDNLHKYELWNV